MRTGKVSTLTITLLLALMAVAGCSKSGSSPTATAKAFFDAVKAKDVPGMKNALSKNSLEMMESFAKLENKSLDEALKEPNTEKQPQTFESQNEKINGDTASLEVKGADGKWETIYFVKEDGQWKLALDKSFQGKD